MKAVPLSAQQEAFLLWMQARSPSRHPAPVCVALRITDRLDAGLLARALKRLAQRHEALRMVFPLRHGRRQGLVLDACPPEVSRYVAEGTDLTQKLAWARTLARRERDREFDVEQGPLARAVVIELAPRDQVLLLAVHHLVFDGWSMDVMLRELAVIYSQLAAGHTHGRELPGPMQCSQVVQLSRDLWPANRRAWSRALAGAPTSLPDLGARKPGHAFSPRMLSFPVPAELASHVRRVARASNATTFMVVLAAWSAVLSSRSGVSDLVVMSPVAGRTFPGSQTAIGCLFVNLLIRVDMSGDPEFSEVLRRVRSSTLSAWSRQDYPYAEFRDEFAQVPTLSFNTSRASAHFPGLESGPLVLPPQLGHLGEDLHVPRLRLHDDGMHAIFAELTFNEEAFDQAAMAELASDFMTRLSGRRVLGGVA